jgi:hypothetical protein
MLQARVKSGKRFEKSLAKSGWNKVYVSPRIKWNGEGRNNLLKIQNAEYNPVFFSMTQPSRIEKCDIKKYRTRKYREAKKYTMDDARYWRLYSEPYFKIATRKQLDVIPVDTYNQFVEDFYKMNTTNGVIQYVQEKMLRSVEGITMVDGYVPMENLEFRTVISENNWKGYHRIQIQFRIKQ